MEVPYTRIVEYKWKPNQPAGVREAPGTVVFKEFSVDEGEPYYPVPNPDNQALFEKYRALADKEPGVCFVGRLASYKCAHAGRSAVRCNLGASLTPPRRAQVFQHGPGDPERAGDVRRPGGEGHAEAQGRLRARGGAGLGGARGAAA